MVKGCACRTEYQNAVGVWPDRVRPDRSVIVPEIMIGSVMPRSSKIFSRGEDAGLGVERVGDGLEQQQVGAAVDQPVDRLAIGRDELRRR